MDDKRQTLIREIAAVLGGLGVKLDLRSTAKSPRDDGGYASQLRSSSGRRRPVLLYPVPGALGLAAADRIAAATRKGKTSVIVLTGIVGRKLAELLIERQLGYVDLAGNCHLELDDGDITFHVEGRRPPNRPVVTGSLRAAGYRTLFALLAKPKLLTHTVRDIGRAAKTSRHAAQSLLARLRDEGILNRGGRSLHVYAPGGREKCIDRFTAGWADVLRSSLLIGRFRMREQDHEAVKHRIERILHSAKVRFGFGASHGSSHWLPYLQGDETTIHVANWSTDLVRKLGAVPDRQGPVHVFRTMTELDLESGVPDTAHPLLIHAELARSPAPRAREAARLMLDLIAKEPE